eukprot:4675203-Amphidinium_carterae.1
MSACLKACAPATDRGLVPWHGADDDATLPMGRPLLTCTWHQVKRTLSIESADGSTATVQAALLIWQASSVSAFKYHAFACQRG